MNNTPNLPNMPVKESPLEKALVNYLSLTEVSARTDAQIAEARLDVIAEMKEANMHTVNFEGRRFEYDVQPEKECLRIKVAKRSKKGDG